MIKYKEIANSILESIENGEYKNTNKLPTEENLMKKYNVSKSTIRNAINVLCSYGIVYMVQGSGMFIRERTKDHYLALNLQRGVTSGYPEDLVDTKCLFLEIVEANEEIAEKMKCDLNTPMYFIKRLRIVNNNYYSVEYTYYNKNIIPYLNKEIAEDSIYKYIKEGLKLNIAFADKFISCEKLSKEDADLLNLEENEPALVINDIVYLSNGTIFNASRVIYNYKKTKVFATASSV